MSNKKEKLKFALQIIVSVLTALATALGTTSCMHAVAMV